MEVVKHKILLENSVDRTFNSPNWGSVTANTFFVNVFLSQDMDDMGLFTDMDYIPDVVGVSNPPDYSILISGLTISGFSFPFMTGGTPQAMTGITGTTQVILRLTGTTPSTYYNFGNLHITGATDSKLSNLISYNILFPFIPGFDIDVSLYTNYNNVSFTGVSRVYVLGDPIVYVFDTKNDANLGTPSQITGILYKDSLSKTRDVVIDGVVHTIPLTTFDFVGEGWNQTTLSLSANTKEEYLFGIIAPPEVQSDVFIDRGITSVFDYHLKLSEIKTLGELINYGNGFYKLRRE